MHHGGAAKQFLDAPRGPLVLHGDAQPDVRGRSREAPLATSRRTVAKLHQLPHSLGALRQNLKRVLRRLLHRDEDVVQKAVRHVLVEEVRETAHEHSPWLLPAQRRGQPVRVQQHGDRALHEAAARHAERRRPLDVAVSAYDSLARLWCSR